MYQSLAALWLKIVNMASDGAFARLWSRRVQHIRNSIYVQNLCSCPTVVELSSDTPYLDCGISELVAVAVALPDLAACLSFTDFLRVSECEAF